MQSDPHSNAMTSIDGFPASAPIEATQIDRHQEGRDWALLPIVALSGFAGLGYEIVWIRQLSLALGSDMMAVLGAVGGFFAGLALGAFALDGAIRQARSPRIIYAVLEAIIGLWGLVNIWLLPAAGGALTPLLGTKPPPALLWSASFALPVFVLLPATVAMGGTLAALERMTREASGKARVSAGVYGANTGGAVAGTLISTFVLIPILGLSGTLLCLACMNVACALGALLIGTPAAPAPSEADDAQPDEAVGKIRLTTALFVTGFLGIAFEILVVRLAAQVMQDTVYTFAGLLAAYLLGAAAGGLIWQRAGRSFRNGSLGLLLAATALACLTTAVFAPYITRIAETSVDAGIVGELAVAAALFFLPSAAMGALFGLLVQQAKDQHGSLGWAVGVNGIGAAIAPLITAQILIPALGAWTALIPVSLGYLLLIPLRRTALVWAAAPALLALVLWLRPTPQLTKVPPGGTLLALQEGPMVTASVVDDASGTRYLEVNGRSRMGGTSSRRSDYRQAVLPLLLHPSPHRALFLGIGTGATAVGGARMPGVSVHGVELSREVVDLLPWFSGSGSVENDLTVADARRYVAADSEQHDVIVADLFHPALDGSGSLYTLEHFEAVKRRLTPGGVFCQWLPLYQLDAPSLRAVIRSFLEIYPEGSAWLNHYSVRTPMLALIGRKDESATGGSQFDIAALAARLRDPWTGAVVKPLGFETPIDLLGQYLAGPRALSAFAGKGPRNTDDYPFVTFDAHRNVQALMAPPWSLLLAVIREIQPDPDELLTTVPQRDALGERLTTYWRARNVFLEAGATLPGDPRDKDLIAAAAPGLLSALRLSPEFEPAYGPLMSMAKSLMASDRAAAIRLLREIRDAAPSRTEARDMLARESGPRREFAR